jgi:hypothetical protein
MFYSSITTQSEPIEDQKIFAGIWGLGDEKLR